jgi:hypothetical protein
VAAAVVKPRMPVLRGRERNAPLSADVDVVIVGSGAGGAVLARELTRATAAACSSSKKAVTTRLRSTAR